MEKNRWYKDKVFYQIWPRSFKDGNNDGMGDLIGVYEKLDYIKSLGCDGIWFSPLYPSPGVDCGYDISNYLDIASEFGGMEAFKQVLDGAHERGMKVIMDLVVNHTSTEHEWFKKSRERIEPYTDYYIWREGKNNKLPNNWDSLFEGKAWKYDEVRKEYYMHLFAIEQADLNMDNPLVREEVKKILRFWLDLGVDGFREDVITFISKKEGLPNDYLMPASKGFFYFNHGPHLHEYLEEFNRDVFSHYDCMILAEAPMVTPKKALEYIDESNNPVLDMMIQFKTQEADCLFTDFNHVPFSLRRLKKAYSSWQNKLEGKGWNMLYIENHDHPRMVSRYGSEKFREESAKMLAVSYLFLKGTPFIYQGQEIGMTNMQVNSLDDFIDIETINVRKTMNKLPLTKKYIDKSIKNGSRDNSRVPMHWDDSEYAGFSNSKPWLKVNENKSFINVKQSQNDPSSILNYYKKLIKVYKEYGDIVRDGIYLDLLPNDKKLFTYERRLGDKILLVVSNFSNSNIKCDILDNYKEFNKEVLLNNYDNESNELKPYQSILYYLSK